MRHLVFVTLYRCLPGMRAGFRTPTQSDKYQVSHSYGNFLLMMDT